MEACPPLIPAVQAPPPLPLSGRLPPPILKQSLLPVLKCRKKGDNSSALSHPQGSCGFASGWLHCWVSSQQSWSLPPPASLHPSQLLGARAGSGHHPVYLPHSEESAARWPGPHRARHRERREAVGRTGRPSLGQSQAVLTRHKMNWLLELFLCSDISAHPAPPRTSWALVNNPAIGSGGRLGFLGGSPVS